ncbi:YebC/PmpR family DNA-binding transcriptional regulator [Candidatus Roizmanbacteria bacterium]|nr:YebC/PmpR family DNA-binding transcriptional regulator [Candidatus Roizmanbacteria bacterium]
MSGHSKWSTIKRQKESLDQKRGQVFTKLARAITLAVRESGGNTDSTSNFKLRLAIEKAKTSNMPRDNIERAIDRAAGKGETASALEYVVYEGYGPGGIAVIVETATDNKQRTSALLKHVFEHSGGNLGSSGSVSFLFQHQGLISIKKTPTITEDSVLEKAVEYGAIDMEIAEDAYEIYTEREQLHAVKEKLEQGGFALSGHSLVFRPQTAITVTDKKQADHLIAFMEELENTEDVQEVFANFELQV